MVTSPWYSCKTFVKGCLNGKIVTHVGQKLKLFGNQIEILKLGESQLDFPAQNFEEFFLESVEPVSFMVGNDFGCSEKGNNIWIGLGDQKVGNIVHGGHVS